MPIEPLYRGVYEIVAYSGRRGGGTSSVVKYLKRLGRDDQALFFLILQRLARNGVTQPPASVRFERDGIWRIGVRKHHFPFFVDGKRLVVTHGFASRGGPWPKKEWQTVKVCRDGIGIARSVLGRKRGNCLKDEVHPLFDELLRSSEGQMALQRQAFFLDAVEAIRDAMADKGVNQSELARLMGRPRSQVSRWLNGTVNMTLSTLADMLFVLDCRPTIGVAPRAYEWETTVSVTGAAFAEDGYEVVLPKDVTASDNPGSPRNPATGIRVAA